jgi:NAD(P)H dehydrogenase (quinone)
MKLTVIGATGRVGQHVVSGLLERKVGPVTALVRDPAKAERLFGDAAGLTIRPGHLDDPRELSEALSGTQALFIAMGSIGDEAVLQRIMINAASRVDSIEQVTRLSVLNASRDSRGINQRGHYSIDRFAESTGVPYSTIRPTIFSASMLSAAGEIRASRTWTGLADSGRVALIDHRDVAEAGVRVLADRALWNSHHALTGPELMTWPEALGLLSAEIGERVTFQTIPARDLLEGMIGRGIPAGMAELLIAREWAILAGENDYATDVFAQITGHEPRPVTEFLRDFRDEFI